jgi:hypothetical protein
LKSSLGTDEINNNTHSSDTEEEESVKKVSKKIKHTILPITSKKEMNSFWKLLKKYKTSKTV